MQKLSIDDTIAAISTPIGEGGIGIARLSGKEALAIADKVFVSRDGKKPSGYGTYTTHYGWIIGNMTGGGNDSDNIIDEVILTVMRAPKSYTKEDIVEINCHGGIVPLKKVLELLLGLGARLAEPGEFTKRAFLNGRIDLAQAEAVLDVITAKTQKGLGVALSQLEGKLSGAVRTISGELLDIKTNLEAAIDFPDEGLDINPLNGLKERLRLIKEELGNFIKSADAGKIVREGLTCVICGKPNVGKSSLMNELLKEERMIVTPIPGTTRDAVCEYINIDGVPLNIVDTAGISDTSEPLEKEGVIKSKLYLDKADLVLFMLDLGTGILNEDKRIVELIKDKAVICVLNKCDLGNKRDIVAEELKRLFGRDVPSVKISALKKINIDSLYKGISGLIWEGKVFSDDSNILINTRHKDALLKALGFVDEAVVSLDTLRTEEIICVSIDEAISSLREITGEKISDEVLSRIFEKFCVGK